MDVQGDVLSGTSSSSGVHHHGVFEGWFGPNRWNGRFVILLITTIGITPLTCFKRVGTYVRARIQLARNKKKRLLFANIFLF